METNAPNIEFSFEGLIIFEMSKNHAGDVNRGLSIVDACAELAREENIRGAVKLQFRDLDSYIHPAYREKGDERMQRYYSSHLTKDQFATIVERIHEQGLVSMSTPFDEPSVDTIEELGVGVIKIASSSARDWPLLERVVRSKKPVVVSTGGLKLPEIDDVVNFFQKHEITFTLLHCVGLYPTPMEHKQLYRIKRFVERYPDVTIGFSTHEDPKNTRPVQIAYALGARCFEKHVIVLDEQFKTDPSYQKVLGYTATPEQTRSWIHSYKDAKVMLGTEDAASYEPSEQELASLASMKRGIYAARDLVEGERLTHEDVFFAIPLQEGQLEAGAWREGMRAPHDTAHDKALTVRRSV